MKKFLLLILIVIIGIVVWRAEAGKDDAKVVVQDDVENVEIPALAADVAVYVRNQESNGKQLVGEVVVLSGDGFVVIRESDDGSLAGPIGSSALMNSGRHENYQITLDRDSVPSETLYAMAYSDTDKNGIFDASIDRPMLDSSGNRVYMIFAIKN